MLPGHPAAQSVATIPTHPLFRSSPMIWHPAVTFLPQVWDCAGCVFFFCFVFFFLQAVLICFGHIMEGFVLVCYATLDLLR